MGGKGGREAGRGERKKLVCVKDFTMSVILKSKSEVGSA